MDATNSVSTLNKKNILFIRYFKFNVSYSDRIHLAKLRMSDRILETEAGRHSKLGPISRDERICKLCQTAVKDKPHFLLQCTAYNNQRIPLLQKSNNVLPNSPNQNSLTNYIAIMSSQSHELMQYL